MRREAEVPGAGAIPRNVDSTEWHLSQIDGMLEVIEQMIERDTLPEGAGAVIEAADLGVRVSSRAVYRVWSILNALIQGSSPDTDSYMRRMIDDIKNAEAMLEAWPEK